MSARRSMIETAASKRMFAKAARGNVTVAADLADTVAELLKRRCLNHLGLARRAGLVAAGAEKVRAQIAAGRTAALFEAADGSPQERRKFVALVPGVPMVDVFTGAELGAHWDLRKFRIKGGGGLARLDVRLIVRPKATFCKIM